MEGNTMHTPAAPATVAKAERPKRDAFRSVKPITQAEIINAVRGAVALDPIAAGASGDARSMAVRGRLAYLVGYLGNGRPALRAALAELAGMPPEAGQ